MTAQEWRDKTRAAAAGVELALPSGMTIRARRPDPAQFAEWRMLPMMLASAAKVGGDVGDEQAEEIAGMIRELLVWCCLEPRISPEPKDASEMHPREIGDADLFFIIAWAMRIREVDALRSFRGGRRTDGAAGGDEQAVLLQTVEPAGDRGPVGGSGFRPGGGAEGAGAGEPGK